MVSTPGDHAVLLTSAASKAVSCGAWRCTVHLPRPARLLALCVHSGTQTCREHLRLVLPATKWTRAQSEGRHSSRTRQKTRRWAQYWTAMLFGGVTHQGNGDKKKIRRSLYYRKGNSLTFRGYTCMDFCQDSCNLPSWSCEILKVCELSARSVHIQIQRRKGV